ncbi:hypothetical protein E2I00_008132 [Balaenoptera physalus]|uniref:Pyrin domain-containing protein n=1 Tax=Balaenoptera physalus TaxID=9770 RepID=A0A643C3V6_BALPH|nr:hypothetical protein E2I00_008132 [Balaenoptera physalus]
MGCTRDAILDALENLTADEFKKFKMKLLSVPLHEGYGRIPRGTLLPMDAVDLTDKLVSYYLEAYGAELTVLVLCNMGMQEVAEQLEETLRKGECAPSTGPNQYPLYTLLPTQKPRNHASRDQGTSPDSSQASLEAHAELSYISKRRSGSDEALVSACSWGSRLPRHFILPASVTMEWSLTHHLVAPLMPPQRVCP